MSQNNPVTKIVKVDLRQKICPYCKCVSANRQVHKEHLVLKHTEMHITCISNSIGSNLREARRISQRKMKNRRRKDGENCIKPSDKDTPAVSPIVEQTLLEDMSEESEVSSSGTCIH